MQKAHLAGGTRRDYLLWMREKLNVRLPGDEGPNPYDSKTDLKSLGPKWLTSWEWWFSIIGLGVALTLARLWSGG